MISNFSTDWVQRHPDPKDKRCGVFCWTCGAFVGRTKGNLRHFTSWCSAIESQLLRHLRKHERQTLNPGDES